MLFFEYFLPPQPCLLSISQFFFRLFFFSSLDGLRSKHLSLSLSFLLHDSFLPLFLIPYSILGNRGKQREILRFVVDAVFILRSGKDATHRSSVFSNLVIFSLLFYTRTRRTINSQAPVLPFSQSFLLSPGKSSLLVCLLIIFLSSFLCSFFNPFLPSCFPVLIFF